MRGNNKKLLYSFVQFQKERVRLRSETVELYRIEKLVSQRTHDTVLFSQQKYMIWWYDVQFVCSSFFGGGGGGGGGGGRET